MYKFLFLLVLFSMLIFSCAEEEDQTLTCDSNTERMVCEEDSKSSNPNDYCNCEKKCEQPTKCEERTELDGTIIKECITYILIDKDKNECRKKVKTTIIL